MIGLETDFNKANVSGSDNRTGTASSGIYSSTATVTSDQKMSWFGTLRPRVGFLATDSLLVYGTGGLAYGHISAGTSLTETTCTIFLAACANAAPAAGSASSTRAGWTVGGGTEWAVASKWSLKAEYLYVHLGDLTYANSPLTIAGASVVNTTSVAHFNSHIARLGLNYKFN